MDQPSRRFARVFQSVTVEFQIDLEARALFQVLVDHTAPLRAFGVAPEGEEPPGLAVADEELALAIASRSADAWPPWPRQVILGHDPSALPPFEEAPTTTRPRRLSAHTPEDAAIGETLDLLKTVACCDNIETGCYHRYGECCCSCDRCLCAYTAFQVEQQEALVSRYLPKLGYAVIVEILATEGLLAGGEIVALLAPGKVWFPENPRDGSPSRTLRGGAEKRRPDLGSELSDIRAGRRPGSRRVRLCSPGETGGGSSRQGKRPFRASPAEEDREIPSGRAPPRAPRGCHGPSQDGPSGDPD